MTLPLTFHQPHPGGRILLMLGEHHIGAVLPPWADGSPWTWRFWLNAHLTASDGEAKNEQAAKDALLVEARDWLRKAGVA